MILLSNRKFYSLVRSSFDLGYKSQSIFRLHDLIWSMLTNVLPKMSRKFRRTNAFGTVFTLALFAKLLYYLHIQTRSILLYCGYYAMRPDWDTCCEWVARLATTRLGLSKRLFILPCLVTIGVTTHPPPPTTHTTHTTNTNINTSYYYQLLEHGVLSLLFCAMLCRSYNFFFFSKNKHPKIVLT